MFTLGAERKAHVELLGKRLSETVPNVIVLTGGKSSKESKRLLEQVASAPQAEPLVIIATGKYIRNLQ